MLALAHVVHLFAHELARLRRCGFPLTLVAARSPQRFFLRHNTSSLITIASTVPRSSHA